MEEKCDWLLTVADESGLFKRVCRSDYSMTELLDYYQEWLEVDWGIIVSIVNLDDI